MKIITEFKIHEQRELVNDLRDICLEYKDSQAIRERISRCIREFVDEHTVKVIKAK